MSSRCEWGVHCSLAFFGHGALFVRLNSSKMRRDEMRWGFAMMSVQFVAIDDECIFVWGWFAS
jgi:hypothetical protein